MSIATVVTRGYGTASYADVNKLPTLGYSIAAVVINYGRLEFTIAPDRLEFTCPDDRFEFTCPNDRYEFTVEHP